MSFDLITGGDFSSASAGGGKCYVTGMLRQPGDVGIFRAGTIDFEGFLDVSIQCITNAAQQIGWISPDKVTELSSELIRLEDLVKSQSMTIKILEDTLKNHDYLNREFHPEDFKCDKCDFVGANKQGLDTHKRLKHA